MSELGLRQARVLIVEAVGGEGGGGVVEPPAVDHVGVNVKGQREGQLEDEVGYVRKVLHGQKVRSEGELNKKEAVNDGEGQEESVFDGNESEAEGCSH